MYQFIESIRLDKGHLPDLRFHQARMDRAREEFFKHAAAIDLKKILSECPFPSVSLHKIRLIYDTEVRSVQISHYTVREIKKLRLVASDSISYSHKFENRTELELLLSQRQECDDIIIVKNNKITDASFANLTFKRGSVWVTPSSYLLNGTMRQQLLNEKKIIEEEITVGDLSKYQKVKLINSMMLFNAPEIDVSKIVD